jgi:hypothetical protein
MARARVLAANALFDRAMRCHRRPASAMTRQNHRYRMTQCQPFVYPAPMPLQIAADVERAFAEDLG